ncbi:MAG: hypothetical protein JOZ31_00515 [Verrucomicrobia bacterium]|nr:hypothetical protein [Verrucomicrobiota bacterium]
MPYRLRELCVFVSVATLPLGAVFALDSAETVKSVLVLCGESGDLPAMQAMEENLREAFHSSRFPRIDLFSEYLDFARFSGDQQLGLKALRWQWVPYGASENDSSNPLLINWQALKKAALPEERVPAAAEMSLRPPEVWETNRVLILAALAAVLLQTILIAGLISQRHSRRKAEASLRQSEERLSLVADSVNLGIEAWDTAKD